MSVNVVKKKAYSSLPITYICFLLIIIETCAYLYSIFLSIKLSNHNNFSGAMTLFMISTIGCGLLLLIGIYSINHIGYIVYYDKTHKSLHRRGFLFGYKSSINIADIKAVEIRTITKVGEFYVIIDSYHKSFDGTSKNAFFRLKRNEKNLLFIRQFWDGRIE